MNDYAMTEAQANKLANSLSVGIGGSTYIPPTQKQRLMQQKQTLEAQLVRVNAALEAINAHPEFEDFLNKIQAVS
jgi:hypothetical protein